MSRPLQIGVLAIQGDFAAHAATLRRIGCAPIEVRRPAELAALDGLILPGGESTTLLRLLHAFGLWEPLRELAVRGIPIFGTCAGLILLAGRVTNPPQESLQLLDVDVRRNGYGRQIDSFVAPGRLRLPSDLTLPAGMPFEDRSPTFLQSGDRSWSRDVLPPVDETADQTGDGAGELAGEPVSGAPGELRRGAAGEAAGDAAGKWIATEFVFIRAPVITALRDGVEVLALCEEIPVLVRQRHLLAASYHPELSVDGLAEGVFVAMVERARRRRAEAGEPCDSAPTN